MGADVGCGRSNCDYCKNGSVNTCDLNFAIGHQFEGGFNQYMKINKKTLLNGPLTKYLNIFLLMKLLYQNLWLVVNAKNQCEKKKTILIMVGPIGYLLVLLKLY